ncbi:CST complex subunit Ten1 [Trichoderma ceciliae]
MSWGPVSSQLCLLSQLKNYSVGNKVRFLGCVISYDTSTACLNLGHMYPPGTDETVWVNIELILETIPSALTQVGQWVNVVGYIMEGNKSGVQRVLGQDASPVHVQALLMWSTGPLDIGRYEKSLRDQMARS